MDLRFFFIDVKTTGEDFAGVESFDKSGFVDDGAAGGVDDYDAVFHGGELGGGDHVVGGFLGI